MKTALLLLILFSVVGCASAGGGGDPDPDFFRALSSGLSQQQPVQYQTIRPYQPSQHCFVQSLGGGYSTVRCH